jgi:hypothetical protein
MLPYRLHSEGVLGCRSIGGRSRGQSPSLVRVNYRSAKLNVAGAGDQVTRGIDDLDDDMPGAVKSQIADRDVPAFAIRGRCRTLDRQLRFLAPALCAMRDEDGIAGDSC